MTPRRIKQNLVSLLVLGSLALTGIILAIYVLDHERLPNPFASTYTVNVQLTAADGVVPGYGQPVNVAGVPVGVITGARVSAGQALLRLTIQRGELPHVYRNATADLEPVTPLKDMELDLNPGWPAAGPLPSDGTVAVSNSTSPGELEDLLSALDTDTRAFLTSLITSLGTGTAGQGENLRRVLVALGPTAGQIQEISTALAARRSEIAQLVHNLAIVTRAASEDGELSQVVIAGDATLHAVATQSAALRTSIAELPPTLSAAREGLTSAEGLAHAIGPTVTALSPSLRHLPAMLHALGPFAEGTASALHAHIRPFVRTAVTPSRQLAAATPRLLTLTPQLTNDFKVLNYLGNELAYNPGNGDPGFLFWLDWAAHNIDSATGNADAMGSMSRTLLLSSCNQLTDSQNAAGLLEAALGVQNLCNHAP